jgi:hypothetical protein
VPHRNNTAKPLARRSHRLYPDLKDRNVVLALEYTAPVKLTGQALCSKQWLTTAPAGLEPPDASRGVRWPERPMTR